MTDSIPESDSSSQTADEPQPRPVMTAICPQRRISDQDWVVIKTLAEKGVTYREIGEMFAISGLTIGKRASRDKWITPMRLMKAKNGTLTTTSDPAHHVANLWASRSDASREMIYSGMNKSLERFMAMAPVPQTFAEAATAAKLMRDAIDPSGLANSQPATTVNILTASNFSPKPVIDV